MLVRLLGALAQNLSDVPHSLNPRFVTARAREASVCRTGCFLLGLCCWVAMPFSALLIFQTHAWLDAFDPERLLNETLATVPDFELTVSHGVATRLPPDSFFATLPATLFQLLVDQPDPLDTYFRAAVQHSILWWQGVFDPQHPATSKWWRETQSLGVPGPDEFQLGELVTVRPMKMPWRPTGVSALWPTVGSERAKNAERLAKVVGVHPSRTLSDFSYTIVYCDGNNELSLQDLQPGRGFRRRATPNCTATVDTSLVDPKTRSGRELRYGLSVHGTRLPSVRATFGAQHTRISSAEAVLAEPPDAASNLTNARALSGRVAVVRRGGCEFVDKAARVQQAGAIAMVIINYEDQDVKAGSAEGGVADTITIPVVTVRRTIGAPLFAHAAQVADAFEHDQASSPSQYKKLRGVEVSLAFGAARYTQTATPSPQSVQVAETVLSKQQPRSQYWEAVEASWRREGGWRGDPGLRGRQVVVSSTRLRRTARAARTIGVVNGAASAMDWEDNWPALAAQAEMLLTRHRMFTFAGYSHHYGGFWRFEDDPTDRSVSYPYTEAGLQAVAPLWLASILFCEVPPVDPTAGASTVPGSTCESEDSLETDDGSTSGEFAVGGVADEDRDKSPSSDTDKPAAGPGPVSYDSSPFLNLNCSNAIAASRTSALLRSVRSGMLGAASSLKLQYVIIDVMVVAVVCMDSLIRLLPMWSILYVPACYVTCNVLRHVDSPCYTIRESILIASYAFTPIALLDGLSHGLSRALGTSPPMLPIGGVGTPPPEWLSYFVVSLVRAFWTPLGAFSLWSTFLAHWHRSVLAEGGDTDPESQSRTRSSSTVDGTATSRGDGGSTDTSDVDETMQPMCRICMDGVEEEENLGPLISPCLCRGSMSYVHSGCLNRWRMSSVNRNSSTQCDSCK